MVELYSSTIFTNLIFSFLRTLLLDNLTHLMFCCNYPPIKNCIPYFTCLEQFSSKITYNTPIFKKVAGFDGFR